jgi:hypothetical protein
MFNHFFNVIYKTIHGQLMVAKRINANTEEQANEILLKSMRASFTFKEIITTIKL